MMFRLYSKGCEYVLRALAQMPQGDGVIQFQAGRICEEADVPESSTRKALQCLSHAGVLATHRGPGGGYQLARRPEDISLLDVILAVDGDSSFSHCLMRSGACDAENPCPVHESWAVCRAELTACLATTSLRSLIDSHGWTEPESITNGSERDDDVATT